MRTRQIAAAAAIAGTLLSPVSAQVVTHKTEVTNNWAGQVKLGRFTGISASWNVVPVAGTGDEDVSQWVGLNGASAKGVPGSILQAGFDATPQGDYAWYEDYPKPTVNLNMVIEPCDNVQVSIQHVKGKTWNIAVIDSSDNEAKSFNVKYSAPAKSADFITEAPTMQYGATHQHFATLPFFGSTSFQSPAVQGHVKSVYLVTMVRPYATVTPSNGGFTDTENLSIPSTVPTPGACA